MADKEELQTQLETYHVQLQQVEAALASSPDDPDLKKLREDLSEVINLTKSLLGEATAAAVNAEPEDFDGAAAAAGVDWKVGDKVMAPWSQDGQYYNAAVSAVSVDGAGMVTVTFDQDGSQETVFVNELKTRGSVAQGAGGKQGGASKRQNLAQQKEYKKLKSLKKKERLKDIEQQREAEKKSWQSFSAKALHKKKGVTKKSIFATPESVDGRVGIGTCGVADRPMTEFHQVEKHQVVKKNSTLQHPCSMPGPAGLN